MPPELAPFDPDPLFYRMVQLISFPPMHDRADLLQMSVEVTGLSIACTQLIYAPLTCLSVSRAQSITPPHPQTAQPAAG